MALEAAVAFPTVQSVQDTEPVSGSARPGGQGKQDEAPVSAMYLPAAHPLHSDGHGGWRVFAAYLPAAHGKQTAPFRYSPPPHSTVGKKVGCGLIVGCGEGSNVGRSLGIDVGSNEGIDEGARVGWALGIDVGSDEGSDEGARVGWVLGIGGTADGKAVG